MSMMARCAGLCLGGCPWRRLLYLPPLLASLIAQANGDTVLGPVVGHKELRQDLRSRMVDHKLPEARNPDTGLSYEGMVALAGGRAGYSCELVDVDIRAARPEVAVVHGKTAVLRADGLPKGSTAHKGVVNAARMSQVLTEEPGVQLAQLPARMHLLINLCVLVDLFDILCKIGPVAKDAAAQALVQTVGEDIPDILWLRPVQKQDLVHFRVDIQWHERVELAEVRLLLPESRQACGEAPPEAPLQCLPLHVVEVVPAFARDLPNASHLDAVVGRAVLPDVSATMQVLRLGRGEHADHAVEECALHL
mmetsp:Transcript_67807/g.201765  ORF Transcript_67807/g.201765 Transcript_67807/m.201765 type:complete len:307 (-) Transcript_67807:379-1299(-)